jgi:glycosyltransferase involved in cell wall biosynthesis
MLGTRIALIGSNGKPRRPVRLAGDRPTVSVVIPCYNYGHFLPECVQTITNQPGIGVEVIIVDDCSPDGSAEVAARLADADDRVRLIRHARNQGHIATYNEGLAAATGDYVALVSADDLLTPGALTRAAELLTAEPSVGFVYGRAVQFTKDVPAVRTRATGWITWPGEQWLALRCRSGYNVIASPEVVMRTSLMHKLGGYRPDLPHAGDLEMWLRAAAVSDVGFIVGADQALYRVHDVNMHKTVFDSGRANGKFIDLEQRVASFAAVLDEPNDQSSRHRELSAVAKRTLAKQALNYANYAYARGFADFPVERFEKLAYELDPAASTTSAGRALARRKARGMSRMAVHPLWAPRAVAMRIEDVARRRRRAWVGI